MSHTVPAPDNGAADPLAGTVPRRAEMLMRAREQCVRAVRHFTAVVLDSWGVRGEGTETAVLIVSELATNAVRHGRSDMTVTLAVVGDALRIDVTDHGEPSPRSAPPADDECGRGLDIVGCLADWTETSRQAWGRRVSAVVGIAGRRGPEHRPG